MTIAHWIVNLYLAACIVSVTIRAARDPDWGTRPVVMLTSCAISIAIYASLAWALHSLGAFPWVAP